MFVSTSSLPAIDAKLGSVLASGRRAPSRAGEGQVYPREKALGSIIDVGVSLLLLQRDSQLACVCVFFFSLLDDVV